MSAGELAGTSRMCQMFEAAEREVHWRARPRVGWSAGTGICNMRDLWPWECVSRVWEGE